MLRPLTKAWMVAAGCAGLAASTAGAAADGAATAPAVVPPATRSARSAQAIVDDFDAAKPPEFAPADRANPGNEEIQGYLAVLQAARRRQAELAKEMADDYPDDPRLTEMLFARWDALNETHRPGPVREETVRFLAAPGRTPAERAEALYQQGMALVGDGVKAPDPAAGAAVAEAFVGLRPDDRRGAQLVMQTGKQFGRADAARRDELFRAIRAKYPESAAGKVLAAEARKVEGVGKPFELAFDDAVTGRHVDVQKDLRGKVVVVDFWATWCGPCVAELPETQALYAEYKDKGVEFVGVSLDAPPDQGGLQKLKAFVQERGIGWPQYYQGNEWDGAFSASWGIHSIPAVFVVDAAGKLRSTQARGTLKTLIPELIKERDAAAKAGGR